MNAEIPTEFTVIEQTRMADLLKNEYGLKPTQELIMLKLQDLRRKGCHNLESIGSCPACKYFGIDCQLFNWERLHPEYANDELALRLKEVRKACIENNE